MCHLLMINSFYFEVASSVQAIDALLNVNKTGPRSTFHNLSDFDLSEEGRNAGRTTSVGLGCGRGGLEAVDDLDGGVGVPAAGGADADAGGGAGRALLLQVGRGEGEGARQAREGTGHTSSVLVPGWARVNLDNNPCVGKCLALTPYFSQSGVKNDFYATVQSFLYHLSADVHVIQAV